MKSYAFGLGLYDWLDRFKLDGLTATLRMELRELLTPCVRLREPFHRNEEIADSRTTECVRDLVDWEIVLSSDHVHSPLRSLADNAIWEAALPDLLQDFTVLLRDALDLMRELGGADDKSDLSYVAQPSISKHPQNRDYRDWTALIDLTRDAWLATRKADSTKARLVAESWRYHAYPLFKRLAFFSATHTGVIEPRQALDWLLADTHWWLWSTETEREAIRLLVALVPNLDQPALAELEQAILNGPPRLMFKADIEPDRWNHIVDREVWLRLAKAQATGAALGRIANAKLDELTQQYPRWQLAEDERDEFPFWMETRWGDAESPPPGFDLAPDTQDDLAKWLKRYPSSDRLGHKDGWSERCRGDFLAAVGALAAIVQEDQWPVDRWREALQIGAEDVLLEKSWPVMATVLVGAPATVFQALAHSLSWWLKAQSKIFDGREDLFFALIRRLLGLHHEGGIQMDEDAVFRAINHPVGHVTEALLNWWYRQELKDSIGLKGEVRPLFTQLCDTGVDEFRHGRVLLAAHAIALFRVDEEWARTYLLPLFVWTRSQVEASAAWKGFLWSPRLYGPLLKAIKQPLLETASRYEQLGKHAAQYAEFLTFVALDPGDTFTVDELTDATRALSVEGLQSAAQAVTRALESAGEQHGEYWHNRVLPYLKSVWPKSRDVMTPALSEILGRLCVAAREAFPEAMTTLRHWLQGVEHPDYLLEMLGEAELCGQFPSDALTFLDALIGDDVQWLPRKLKQCLDDIAKSERALATDPRFVRLSELYGRRGIS